MRINTATYVFITSRHGDTKTIKRSVDRDHLMSNVLVCAGRVPNDQRAYPTTDNTFCNHDMKVFASFDGAGNVFDLEGNFLGNPLPE